MWERQQRGCGCLPAPAGGRKGGDRLTRGLTASIFKATPCH